MSERTIIMAIAIGIIYIVSAFANRKEEEQNQNQ